MLNKTESKRRTAEGAGLIPLKQRRWRKRLAAWWPDRIRASAFPIGVFFIAVLLLVLLGFQVLPTEITTDVFGLFGVVIGTCITAWNQRHIQEQQMVVETRSIRREKIERVVELFHDMLRIERDLRFEQEKLYLNKDKARKMMETGSQNVDEIKLVLLVYFPQIHEKWVIDYHHVDEDGRESHYHHEMLEDSWRGMRSRLEEILRGQGEPRFNEEASRLWEIWPDLLKEARRQIS